MICFTFKFMLISRLNVNQTWRLSRIRSNKISSIINIMNIYGAEAAWKTCYCRSCTLNRFESLLSLLSVSWIFMQQNAFSTSLEFSCSAHLASHISFSIGISVVRIDFPRKVHREVVEIRTSLSKKGWKYLVSDDAGSTETQH